MERIQKGFRDVWGRSQVVGMRLVQALRMDSWEDSNVAWLASVYGIVKAAG